MRSGWRFALGVVCNAVALGFAARLVPGIELKDLGAGYDFLGSEIRPHSGLTWRAVLGLLCVAVVFSLVNAVVRPVVAFLSLPATVLTLGLFHLVVNGAMLLLTSRLLRSLVEWQAGSGIGPPVPALYEVGGLVAAVVGAVVVGAVNWVLSLVLPVRR